jgi:serine/threonine-protein kinase ATR
VNAALGGAWLASSKIARKAGHFQAAYSAMLQARHRGAAHYFIQGCKLLKSEGDSIRALQELDNALAVMYPLLAGGTIDLTLSDVENLQQAKVRELLNQCGQGCYMALGIPSADTLDASIGTV